MESLWSTLSVKGAIKCNCKCDGIAPDFLYVGRCIWTTTHTYQGISYYINHPKILFVVWMWPVMVQLFQQIIIVSYTWKKSIQLNFMGKFYDGSWLHTLTYLVVVQFTCTRMKLWLFGGTEDFAPASHVATLEWIDWFFGYTNRRATAGHQWPIIK